MSAVEPQIVSGPMRQLFAKAERVAPQDTTILITGETGVGKERLALWLHAHSRRATRRFVPVNCGALPESLLDSHLFGHARGAFTGAVEEAEGVFEAAAGGTLFLDEVGEVSPAMQVKLLRVLQEREIQRVGDWRLRRIDVRLIAATNRNLQEEVAQGRFRSDLLYRLRVVELRVPPLRSRPGDLQMLARELLDRTADRLRRPIGGFTAEAWACLMAHDWPGNVRELENMIEEACTVASGPEIQLSDLPDTLRAQWRRPASAAVPAANASTRGDRRTGRLLDDLEQAYIEAVCRRQGSRARAARELGISLSTLKRKLRRRKAG